MSRIGIMQGRLSSPRDNRIQFFPRDNWSKEFDLAAQARFDCIEWLYDLHDASINPLATDAGIQEILAISDRHGVRVSSMCAHCFIEKPLVGTSDQELEEGLNTLSWMIQRSKLVGISRIVLPLEDAVWIDNEAEFDRQVAAIGKTLRAAEEAGIEIDLETSLLPTKLGAFLDRLPHPLLKVNYDSGNSAGLGYCQQDEFSVYGHRIGSVHIKDKLFGGTTVALGTGSADFQALFAGLRRIAYTGDFILEVARGVPGDELNWCRQNRAFVLEHVLGTM